MWRWYFTKRNCGRVVFSDLRKFLVCWWHSWKQNTKSLSTLILWLQHCKESWNSFENAKMHKSGKSNEIIRSTTYCSGLEWRKKTGKYFYNCVSITDLHNMMFFLCCLDPSQYIPLWLGAVAITQQHFTAPGQYIVYNKCVENSGHSNNFLQT